MKALFSRCDAEIDLQAFIHPLELDVVRGIPVKIDFPSILQEDKSIALVPKYLADDASFGRRCDADLMRSTFVADLVQLDLERGEGIPDRLLKAVLLFSRGDRMPGNVRDDYHIVGVLSFAMVMFRQGHPDMGHVIAGVQILDTRFNVSSPFGGHAGVTSFDLYVHLFLHGLHGCCATSLFLSTQNR